MSPATGLFSNRLAEIFLDRHGAEAAQRLDSLPATEISRLLESRSPGRAAALLEKVRPDLAAECLAGLGPDFRRPVLGAMTPPATAPLLARMAEPVRDELLALLEPDTAREVRELMQYPPDSAGGLMDSKFLTFSPQTAVQDVSSRLQPLRKGRISNLHVVGPEGRLLGVVPLQEVILAEPKRHLSDLIASTPVSVNAMSSREEVVHLMTEHRLASLPVVDTQDRLLGVIRQDALVRAAQAQALAGIQTMVGVSREERALSSPFFSVRKRLPWLNINLLTAFLAAAVVGLFEETIAQVTALAVLLPVVAGQSGNTGAQALAVTMRGLALREVRIRQWGRLLLKESVAGFINGIAIALVTVLGVFVWSHSPGLCMVIGISMVLAMTMAGAAGAIIPIVLVAFGQDPAQSSSIILTTVTDVTGFFAFLGLATLFMGML